MKYSCNFLAYMVLFSLLAYSLPVKAEPRCNKELIVTDTMVNYCKLVRAAVKYGALSAQNKSQLTDLEVNEFNNIWKDVFDVEYYQVGITSQEFKNPRFREGNFNIFPPSKFYNPGNPDTYSLFHIAKEIGKINSNAYQNCATCIKTSIDKINELINKTGLLNQFSQLWLNVRVLKKFTSVKQITDFWLFLRCYTIDDRVKPKSAPYFISLPPSIRTPDTTIIRCKNEIKPKVSVGWRHCEIGGRIDTSAPLLIKGLDNCPNAVYRITFTAKDFCNKSAKADQYFKILNDDPRIFCLPDTIVDCIENYRDIRPQGATSCGMNPSITSSKPFLISGNHNCPDAVYQVNYILKDNCGREAKCSRRIRIMNDGPVITCPPDQIVTCFDKIQKGIPTYKTSCKTYPKITISDPVLVLGRRNCPGSVYEITYSLSDSCGRRTSCIQKFTINNPGPRIKCPQPKEIFCEDDIMVGLPESVQVSCDLAYTVTTTDPKLIYGKPNCPGAIYEVIYTVTDECGRRDSCEQVFTIFKETKSLKVNCPPDRIVHCSKDIVPETLNAKGSCGLNSKVNVRGPFLVTGKPDCPNARYSLIYDITDDCGRTSTCTQYFTIQGDDLTVICPPDVSVNSKSEIKPSTIQVTTGCSVTYQVTTVGPTQVTGTDSRGVSQYEIIYTITDDCGQRKICRQLFFVTGKPDCESYYPNSEAKLNPQTNTYECYCKTGYEWNATRTACVPSKPDCNAYYPNSEAKLNPQTNTYECYCKTGYEWNATRTACVPAKPDCNAYYPNSEAILNPQTNTYECYCKTGYEWNATRTACVPARPDCNAYYPNSEAKLNPLTNVYECYCKPGYEWNANRTACVPSAPDCNTYYPNSEPKWNPQKNMYECYCKPGYQWNATRTACVATAPDCNSYYPNSEARWNPQKNVYECYCKAGYDWNATRTACVPVQTQLPDCNAYYPNSEAKWNPQKNVYECYCKAGYDWNATRTACVLVNRDNPPVNPNQQKNGVCNTTYRSGANEPEQYTITLNQTTGFVDFSYSTYTVKDRIHIYQGATKIFDSGCVGTSSRVTLTLTGISNIIRIVVDPQCEPNETQSTQWDFNFGCPR